MDNRRDLSFMLSLSSEEILKLQDEELMKPDEEIDWNFFDSCSEIALKMQGQTMNWAPDPKDAYRSLLARLGETDEAAGSDETIANNKPAENKKSNGLSCLFKKRKIHCRYAILAACIACFLVVGTYADINGRVVKNLEFTTITYRTDVASGVTVTDHLQTDNPIYKELETHRIPQALLPSPQSLDGYTYGIQDKYISPEYQYATVVWKNGTDTVTYTVEHFEPGTASVVSYKYYYDKTDTFQHNGLEITMNEYKGSITIVFCANDSVFTLRTTLDWDAARALALSIH